MPEPSSPVVDSKVLEKLKRFDTATICNVIELFDIQPRLINWLYPPAHAMFPQLGPVVGFAVTATFRAMSQPEPNEPRISLRQQVEAFSSVPKPWIVVIQDLDDPPQAAVFGEVMVSTYRGFGAVGLVTNGHARDLAAIEPMGFGCWAAGTSPSHAWPRIVDVMVPVRVSGLQVRPGDLLHGDRDGVTSIPLEIAEPLADACEEFLAAEKVVIDEAQSGRADLEAYEKAFREFANRRQALAERLRAIAKSAGADP